MKKYITKEIITASIILAIYNTLLMVLNTTVFVTGLFKVFLSGTAFIFLLKYILKFSFNKKKSSLLGYVLIYLSYITPFLVTTFFNDHIISSHSLADLFFGTPAILLLQTAIIVWATSLILDAKIKKTYLILLITGINLVVLVGVNTASSFIYLLYSELMSPYWIYIVGFILDVFQSLCLFSLLFFWFKPVFISQIGNKSVNNSTNQEGNNSIVNTIVKLIQSLIIIGVIGLGLSLGFMLFFEPFFGVIVISLLSLYIWTAFRKFKVSTQVILISIEHIILLPIVLFNMVNFIKGGYSMDNVGIIIYLGVLILPVSIIRFLRIYSIVETRYTKKVFFLLITTLVVYACTITFGFLKAKHDLSSTQRYFYPCGLSLEHNEEVYNSSNLSIQTDDYLNLEEDAQNNRFLNQSDINKFIFFYESLWGNELDLDLKKGCITTFSNETIAMQKIEFPTRLEITLVKDDFATSLMAWLTPNVVKYTDEDIKDMHEGHIGADKYEAIIGLGARNIFFSGMDASGQKVFGHITCRPRYPEAEDMYESEERCIKALETFKLTKQAQLQE